MAKLGKALLAACLAAISACAFAQAPLADAFAREVERRLDVPPEAQADYGERLEAALAAEGLDPSEPQYFVLVDRNAFVQAVFIYWRGSKDERILVGASPASTGRPGGFEHFLTPLGVFEHSLANPDFRAEGTLNVLGIRGYGVKGMRVYDFGWAWEKRTWGRGGMGWMRLQMHATDPRRLEPRLGIRHSKGCVRIPASLNVFIDRHGLLDAEYEAAERRGAHLWILRPDRVPTVFPGRWLVIVDSLAARRPAWSPLPP